METALEHVLMNTYKKGMIQYVNSHAEAFDEAVKLAVSDKQKYSWRAAWLLWSCMKKNDSRISGYLTDIVQALQRVHDSQKRELLKILQMMEIDEAIEGKLFNICMDIWEQIDKQPSVRINAFRMMILIAMKHHGLMPEVLELPQGQYLESLSPGAKRSVIKLKHSLLKLV